MMMNKALPYDAEVEWIKSITDAYVDTDIKATGNLRIKTTLYNYFTQDFLGRWGFGGRNGYLNKVFGVFISADTGEVIFAYGNKIISLGNYQNYTQIVHVEIGGRNITIGGRAFSYTLQTFISDYPLQLFGLNNGGDRIGGRDVAMGDTYITDGVTTLDLIPVRKNGKGYMYDRLSDRLLATGDFIAGPDKMGGVIKWLIINTLHGLLNPSWEERRVA